MRPVLLCILIVCGSAIPASAQQLKEITNSIGMQLVLIHPGSFTMGSHIQESGRKDRELRHEVTLSKSFYLGVYEVTQGQYEHVNGINPNRSKTNPLPLQNVSWEDAVAFCTKLSELPEEKAAGRVYRLPTEAEWEYACRATSGAAYSFGDSADLLGNFAWFKEDRMLATLPVGLKKANRWGLYDMHGNVYQPTPMSTVEMDQLVEVARSRLRLCPHSGWVACGLGMGLGCWLPILQEYDASTVDVLAGIPPQSNLWKS